MCLKASVDYAIATGEAWNPQAIAERCSDLMRLSDWFERGHLLPDIKSRTGQTPPSPENDGR